MLLSHVIQKDQQKTLTFLYFSIPTPGINTKFSVNYLYQSKSGWLTIAYSPDLTCFQRPMSQEFFFNIFKGLKRKSQQQNQGEYVTERM